MKKVYGLSVRTPLLFGRRRFQKELHKLVSTQIKVVGYYAHGDITIAMFDEENQMKSIASMLRFHQYDVNKIGEMYITDNAYEEYGHLTNQCRRYIW